ncbi:MAG: pullulanase-type alpha-1,6-glucosidase [Gemmatimonadaceae bacterium]
MRFAHAPSRVPVARPLALLPVLAVATFLLPTPATAQAPTRACPASAADTLVRAATSDATARAYWLTATQLQWPGAPADGRYAVYRSQTAALRAEAGRPVQGSDERIALDADAAALPADVATRFAFVPAGARLTLSVPTPATPATRSTQAARLRDQLLLVREDAEGRVLAATGIQLPGALDDLYSAAGSVPDLGATLAANGRQGAQVAVWAPTARAVTLCISPNGSRGATAAVALVLDSLTGTWRGRATGDVRGAAYHYAVDVFVPGAGVVRNRVTDPYAVALTANSAASVFLSLDDPAAQPVGWRGARRPPALAAPTDLTVYELHIRDFSASDASVRAAWRGKYLAFTEPRSAGMRHLRALRAAGITDIHLLPTYDLSTIPEQGCVTPEVPASAPPNSEEQQRAVGAVRDRDCFNWGYDPWHYTAPEGSYATDAADPFARTREFRAMVQSLHDAGLRVGMDVVYNHTFAAGQDARAVLDRIVPGYYHRLDGDGKIAHSTCCENTATEHRMMAKLMAESAATWARHYRIDSFRFDLMGHQPRAAMEALQRAVNAASGRHIPLLGEGWNFGEVADGARFVQASQRSLGGSGIATFSDRGRDALRGGGCCDGGMALVQNQGLLNGLQYAPNGSAEPRDRRAELRRSADLARIGLAGTLRDVQLQGSDGVTRPLSAYDYAGQPAGYAQEPGEVVNYVENHDNLTLFDLNALRLPRGTSRAERARAQVLGIAFVALSQGIAYLHAGIEILRSKSLDKDSFDSGDWFNRLDWSLTNNGFGAGLPPAHRNEGDWSVMRPVLADTSIAPRPADIRWTRDAALDLLRIRSSSTLFRMRTSADVRARLRFENTGPSQDPTVLVGHLDGAGYPGARYREVLYLVNVAPDEKSLALPDEAGKRWTLHPVHRAAHAADRRAATARVERATGRFTVPGRTAVVFVVQ